MHRELVNNNQESFLVYLEYYFCNRLLKTLKDL